MANTMTAQMTAYSMAVAPELSFRKCTTEFPRKRNGPQRVLRAILTWLMQPCSSEN